MSDEEKIRYVFYLFCNFFPTYRIITKNDFKTLTLVNLNIFFTILTLTEDNFRFIQEVCDLVEALPDEITKKRFYYCLVKIKLYTEELNNPSYLDKFLLLEQHVEQLSRFLENVEDSKIKDNFHSLYAKVKMVGAGFDISQTSVKFNRLSIYFDDICPAIAAKMELELERHISQKTNLQSCSMAARLNY